MMTLLKKISTLSFLFLFSTFSLAQKTKVVFVIADGIAPDMLENKNLPNLKLIEKQGGYAKIHVGGDRGTYNETPTISAVGYNSLLTGTWVNKHNVWDNDNQNPNYHYQTIFRLFKEQYPKKKTAIFSSWTDNRTVLLGEGLKETNFFKTDIKFDGLEKDNLNFPHDENRFFMHKIDEAVADAAAKSIKTQAPDLSWVYLEYTDDMGINMGTVRK